MDHSATSINLFDPLCAELKSKILENEECNLPSTRYWRHGWDRLISNPSSLFAICFLFALITMAIVGPLMSPYTYSETHLALKNSPPNWNHLFGTDELGRDLFTRCWWGARISLFVGLTASAFDLMIGVFYGSIAAFCGRKIDETLMRLADVLYSIPYLLIVILLIVIMGSGVGTIILALVLTGWITMARIIRSKVLQIMQQDFIKAAYGLGASRKRILMRHLIPNAIGSIIVTLTLTIPTAIFAEAFLSFLGLGVQSPIASWGAMANDGLAALRYYPWRIFFPGALICLTMISFNLLGDGLRDTLDPRMEK